MCAAEKLSIFDDNFKICIIQAWRLPLCRSDGDFYIELYAKISPLERQSGEQQASLKPPLITNTLVSQE